MFAIIQAAGWPIWPLILTSVLALALIIERVIVLQRKKILPNKLLAEVVSLYRNRQVTPEVIGKLEQSSPLGRVLAAGLRNEKASREVMKDAIEEAGRAASHDMERSINALGTIASIAPLMGLFGTVVGMIEIFGAQAPTGTNPAQLAHGISIALYNTAFGLIIAIPALIFWRYFRARVDEYLLAMEVSTERFARHLLSVRKP